MKRVTTLSIGLAMGICTFLITLHAEEPSRLANWKKPLEDRGVTLGAGYEVDVSKNLSGGISTNGNTDRARFTVNMTLDSEKLLGYSGGKFFVQYQNHNGDHGGADVGDLQQYDGLDDPEYDRIHMCWYEQYLFGDVVRIKLGKVEPKSEFFAPENARNHLGFSTERSPTIAHGPPADSVNLFLYPADNFYLGYGAYDAAFNEGRDENDLRLQSIYGHPADTFHILEAGARWNAGPDTLHGGLKVGGWYLDGTLDRFDGSTEDGTAGGYIALDQDLYNESSSSESGQGLGAYLQYGFADEEVQAITQHFGGGFQWTGLIPSRDTDVIGLGASRVDVTDAPGAGFTEDYEAAYEIFYKAHATEFLMIMADFQYIEHPGGSSRPAANVLTLRAALSL